MGAAADVAMPRDVGEFRLVSREAADALRGMGERHRFVRGLVAWVGYRQTALAFERPGRAAGVTKFRFPRMLRFSFDALTSFSAAPLRLATLLGISGLLIGVLYAGYGIYVGYYLALGAPGWTSLVILNICFSGLILLCLGVIRGIRRAHLRGSQATTALSRATPRRRRRGWPAPGRQPPLTVRDGDVPVSVALGGKRLGW